MEFNDAGLIGALLRIPRKILIKPLMSPCRSLGGGVARFVATWKDMNRHQNAAVEKYRRRESNPHSLGNVILNHARLPIPPHRHVLKVLGRGRAKSGLICENVKV